MARPLYDDGTYAVTAAVVSTPRRFYPIANTTAVIRRDPLWAGCGIAFFGCGSLAVYSDLFHVAEQVALASIAVVALVAGNAFSVLRIDAPGHRSAMLIGRAARMRALFQAIRYARTVDPGVHPANEQSLWE